MKNRFIIKKYLRGNRGYLQRIGGIWKNNRMNWNWENCKGNIKGIRSRNIFKSKEKNKNWNGWRSISNWSRKPTSVKPNWWTSTKRFKKKSREKAMQHAKSCLTTSRIENNSNNNWKEKHKNNWNHSGRSKRGQRRSKEKRWRRSHWRRQIQWWNMRKLWRELNRSIKRDSSTSFKWEHKRWRKWRKWLGSTVLSKRRLRNQ